MAWQLPIGAQLDKDGVRFRVWAENVQRVEVVILGDGVQESSAQELAHDGEGYYSSHVTGLAAGALYQYRLDGDTNRQRPDPASRYQPQDVHGPSQVVDPVFAWSDSEWQGLPLEEMVIYEVHIGTATPEGTFEALIGKLPHIKALGATAIEIMPVANFPGERNWGYDGVDLFAPALTYGRPESLKRLIDAAHREGLAVVQDVVYNHFGPDGNYLRDFSRSYFTGAKKTPWGDALNFAELPVREFFISNALYWLYEFHVDGLRLDATHAILDDSAEHILAEIARHVRENLPEGRYFAIFAEDERNERRLLEAPKQDGMGIDAVWADDFHHEVRSAFAGDNEGYYADFTGSAADIATTLNKGWFYAGQQSEFSGKARGTDASEFNPPRFVYCIQNHDQIGNRAVGDRLNMDISPDAYRAASALLLLSPYTPLLFQGQEWSASTPFLFFTDHNAELGRQITEGRRAEFAHFKGFQGGEVPDPQAESTFEASKLNWQEIEQSEHACILELYTEMLALRGSMPALQERHRSTFRSAAVAVDTVAMRYLTPGGENDALVVVNLKGDMYLDTYLDLNSDETTQPPAFHRWLAVLSTEDPRFGGALNPEQLNRDVEQGHLTAKGPMAVVLQAVAESSSES